MINLKNVNRFFGSRILKEAPKMKKILAIVLTLALMLSAFGTAFADYEANAELAASGKATLNVYGPGLFSSGAEGVTDIVTEITKPGYNEIIAKWNEYYPDCELIIEDIPWDSYSSAITTAAMAGDIDVMIHGHIAGLYEDLRPYLAADAELADGLFENSNLVNLYTADETAGEIRGIDVYFSPVVVWLDKEIFADYGVELPKSDWTIYDLLEIAKSLTGIDPVTGEETYGLQMMDVGGGNIQFNYPICADAIDSTAFTVNGTDWTYDFTSEGSVEALRIISEMAKCASPEAIEGLDVSTSVDGDTNWAMLFKQFSLGNYQQIKQMGLEDKYTFINLPVSLGGTQVTWLGSTGMSIYNGSPDKDWAWEFFRFMHLSDFANEWLVANGYLANGKGVIAAVEPYMTEEDTAKLDYILSNIPEGYSSSWNLNRNGTLLNINSSALVTAVSNVYKSIMTPEEAAQFLQQAGDDYLKTK